MGVDNVVERNDHSTIEIEISNTAHQTSQDSWFQAGFVLTTGMNSAYVLGYSATIMVPLGWIGGVVGLILATVVSLYANALLAHLLEYGKERHIRYRDFVRSISSEYDPHFGWLGKNEYYRTWGMQYANLCMINIGYVILAGYSIKALYVLFRDDGVMKLPHCIAIAGVVSILFAVSVPRLSALGVWLKFSTLFSLVYIVVAIVLSLKDGLKAPPRDYNIVHETTTIKIYKTIGASANLVFPYNTAMPLEIQATVGQPVVKNMMKALYFQFTVGALPMYAVTFFGYWAYGTESSAYLLNNVNGPVWVKATANIAAFLQSVISLHIFASPMYEFLDTKYGLKGNAFAIRNLSFRIIVRGCYLGITTFISASLPFLGDFMSLTGGIFTITPTFILANYFYLSVKKNELSSLQKSWHWLNVGFFSIVGSAAVFAGTWVICLDSSLFHLFADM